MQFQHSTYGRSGPKGQLGYHGVLEEFAGGLEVDGEWDFVDIFYPVLIITYSKGCNVETDEQKRKRR